MKPRRWKIWGKWAFVAGALLAVVMSAVSGVARNTSQPLHMKQAQPVRALHGGAKEKITGGAGDTRVELERLDRAAFQPDETEVGNVFGATSWYVPPPPPPPVKPAPPPKPTAPPMPFSYLGLYEEGPGKVIMLVKGDRVYTVSVGDVIENTYRVDSVEQGRVEMTYLPLNIKQSINIGS